MANEAVATAAAPATGTTPSPTPNRTETGQKGLESTAASTSTQAKPAEDTATKLIERKVNGKVVKATQEEWDKYSSLGLTATERLQEAAGLTKKAQAQLDRMGSAKKAIEFLDEQVQEGKISPEEMRSALDEFYLNKYINPSKMSPEQKRIAELEAENKKWKNQDADRQSQAKAHKEAQEDMEMSKGLIQEIQGIIEETKLPKTRFTANRIAHWIRVNETKGVNATRELVTNQVMNEAKGITRSTCAALKGEALVEHLGEEVVKEIRRFDLEQLRARRQKLANPTPVADSNAEPTTRFEREPRRAVPLRAIWSKR